MRKSLGYRINVGALLVAVTVIAYFPVFRAGFVWDDDATVTANPLVQAADGLGRIWGTTQPRDYWPVTYSALWVEWRAWGVDPLGYHAVNLGLHLAGAFLLWAILAKLRVPGAVWAAFLYAVHPLNVESVAWVTQQKNLWAMLFFLASIGCFLRTELPAAGTEPGLGARRGKGTGAVWYGLSLLAFVLAMLSKGSTALLPLVLLGLVAWRRPVDRRDGIWAAPFLVVAAVLAAVNVWFAHHTAIEAIRTAGWGERLLGAGAVGWFYLGKILWPAQLVFVYPPWSIRGDHLLWWMPLVAAVALSTGLVRRARSKGGIWRRALFAWGYFWLMLIPVMGFTDVYFMKYSLVADHYAHLAALGAIGFVAAEGARWGWGEGPRGRRALTGATAAAVVAGLAFLTWSQCQIYRDLRTLYLTTLARNPDAWVVQFNWGEMLLEQGKVSEARTHFEDALRVKPDYMEAHNDLGIAMAQSNELIQAAGQFAAAVRLKPDYAAARVNWGNALAQTGHGPEGMAQFEAAVKIDPGYAEAHRDLALALAKAGQMDRARVEMAEAIRLQGRH